MPPGTVNYSPRLTVCEYGGMPDWKNPADYGFTSDLDDAGWAWEFLRRNKEYQADYSKVKDAQISVPGKPWLYQVDTEDHLAWKLGEKWNIQGRIADPKQNHPPNFIRAFPRLPAYDELSDFYGAAGDIGPPPRKQEYAVLAFNLRKRLPPQLKRAAVLLNELQKDVAMQKQPNKGEENWQLYLRVLDADEAGATAAEVANTVTAISNKDGNAAGTDIVKIADKYLESARYRANRALHILGSDITPD